MKKAWIMLVAVLMLACVCPGLPSLVADENLARPTPARPATRTATQEFPSTREDFSLVRLNPKAGNLSDQLDVEAGKARSLGQPMFVEFDASW